eukprot:1987290-Pleurochrysis_carterae.AAC.1
MSVKGWCELELHLGGHCLSNQSLCLRAVGRADATGREFTTGAWARDKRKDHGDLPRGGQEITDERD